MDREKLPMLSYDLIKQLDEVFPERCPSLTDSDREVWFKAGQRSVVNFLLLRIKEQEEHEQFNSILSG